MYERRYSYSQRTEGSGQDMLVYAPCPFCAAPNWLVHTLADTEKMYRLGAKCHECGRSARAIYKTYAGYNWIELVHSGGKQPPEWLAISMEGDECTFSS